MTQPAIVSQPIAAATAAMSTANLPTLRLDCNRNVNLIVVHCTASRCDRQLTPESLDRLHRQRGFTACGYHFYITREGTVFPMRPLDTVGAHVRGFNAHSIGIAYEAVCSPTGPPPIHVHRSNAKRCASSSGSCSFCTPKAPSAAIATSVPT